MEKKPTSDGTPTSGGEERNRQAMGKEETDNCKRWGRKKPTSDGEETDKRWATHWLIIKARSMKIQDSENRKPNHQL